MSMNKVSKEAWAKDFREKLDQSVLTIFAGYRGVKATEADELRKKLRDTGANIKVLKNNIARKAVADHPSEDTKALLDNVVGPTLVAFGLGDPAKAAKAFHDFAKDHEALQIQDSLLEGKKVPAAQIEALAKLPPYEVMLSQFLSVLQGPARNFVSVLAAVPRDFVGVLDAIRRKKEEGGN